MLKKVVLIMALAMILFICIHPLTAEAESGVVYRLQVEDEVAPGMVKYLQRGLNEAKQAGASLIILEFDTPGGYIDSAKEIGKLLFNADIPCVAFINRDALSAGAYLAISCDYIFMTPGSTMGAAEVRLLGSDEPADEKTLSSWGSKMRSAAELTGRDPLLAEAMVRRDISIEGLVDSEELLTLTPEEALEWNYSDGTVNNVNELLSEIDFELSALRDVEPNMGEKLSGVLTDPIMATFLLTIGLAALVIEIFATGFGVFGFISFTAFALYFGGSIMAGQSGYETIFFFLLGLALMIIEIFVPGFGVFGIGGLISLTVAIVIAASSARLGVYMLLISAVIAVAIIYFAFKFLDKRGFLDHFILRTKASTEGGYTSHSNYSGLNGLEGKTVTSLRPSGTALVAGKRVDVISQGEYIPAATKVKIVDTSGGRIIVVKTEES